MKPTRLALAAAVVLAGPPLLLAHELSPALLSLVERAPGRFEVTWRVPIGLALLEAPSPIWPAGVEREGTGDRERAGDMEVERYRVRAPGGFAGRTLAVRGGGPRLGEVLVRLATLDGKVATGRIFPGRAGYTVPGATSRFAVVGLYLRLGVEHILGGFDHLLFVLALTLLSTSLPALVKTVTAFTAAHSLTLALAALGLVHVPPAPVEAVIALSIVFVARELWLQANRRTGLGARRPWPIAFGFGLLHGLGFAGALGRVGLPEGEVPLALLAFNLGVEVGQLLIVALVWAAVRWLLRRSGQHKIPGRLLVAYGTGVLATFWLFERVATFW